MSIAETLLPEFDVEMATTRRLLERVPGDKGQWKPHEKSFPLGHLAQLVSSMPGWITQMITGVEIDLAAQSGYTFEKTASLIAQLDRNVKEARATIAASTDADYKVEWRLKMGDHVLLTQSRWDAVRSTINHLVHHQPSGASSRAADGVSAPSGCANSVYLRTYG